MPGALFFNCPPSTNTGLDSRIEKLLDNGEQLPIATAEINLIAQQLVLTTT